MNNTDKILEILSNIKPNRDMSQIEDIIEGGYLDSFELLALIAQLSDTFGIEIDFDEIAPQNFNSVEAIAAMVNRIIANKKR